MRSSFQIEISGKLSIQEEKNYTHVSWILCNLIASWNPEQNLCPARFLYVYFISCYHLNISSFQWKITRQEKAQCFYRAICFIMALFRHYITMIKYAPLLSLLSLIPLFFFNNFPSTFPLDCDCGENMRYLPFWVCIISLNVVISSSIHFLTYDVISTCMAFLCWKLTNCNLPCSLLYYSQH